MASAMVDGADVGISGCTPGLAGWINVVPQCLLKTAGCDVRTRHPSVPHPNAQLTEEEQALR